MKTSRRMWRVIVTPTRAVLHPYDKDVGGQYEVLANSEKQALDKFHRTIPIKVLDDFSIEVVHMGRPPLPGRKVTVKLEEPQIKRAADLGGGNVARGIRKALS